MEERLRRLQIALNQATAETGVMNHLLLALVAQAPDKRRLLADFAGAVEETNVTAMNSPVPEEFVARTQEVAEAWKEQIEAEIALEDEEEQTDSGPTQTRRPSGGG